jgi:hypothetical protein
MEKTSRLQPPADPLQAAFAATVTRLTLTATAAGLPDIYVKAECRVRDGQQHFTYCILANKPSLAWSHAPISVEGETLGEAEIAFYEALAEREFHRAEDSLAQEPCQFGDAQLASTLALALAA